MAQIFRIHPENPQHRLLDQIIAILNNGGVIAYPTDSGYALGCLVGNKEGSERIRQIRNLDAHHNFTLICSNLSELATYAHVDNTTFRLLKAYTPGPYTFILLATKEVPNRLKHSKRKTIGIRIPDHKVVLSLLEKMTSPLMSVSLFLPDEEYPLYCTDEIYAKLKGRIDAIIDTEFCNSDPSTVIDFVANGDGTPKVLRKGKGDVTPFIGKTRDIFIEEKRSKSLAKKLAKTWNFDN